jgi:hypothetical protein
VPHHEQKHDDQRQSDDPEGVVEQARREDGPHDRTGHKAGDEQGEVSKLAQPGCALVGCAGREEALKEAIDAVRMLPVMKVELYAKLSAVRKLVIW